jgi:thiol-disulfide isomerase/thioredoxin
MMNTRLRTMCLLALLLLALASPAAAVLQKGQAAPPIQVVTTSGQRVSLTNYRGHVLIMDFFATWCVPCRESIPHLIGLNSRYAGQGLQILGMSVDDEGDKEVKAFVVDKRINYPVALVNEDVQADYGLRSVPTIFVISKKGIVAEKFMGYNEQIGRNIETLVKKLLAE